MYDARNDDDDEEEDNEEEEEEEKHITNRGGISSKWYLCFVSFVLFCFVLIKGFKDFVSFVLFCFPNDFKDFVL